MGSKKAFRFLIPLLFLLLPPPGRVLAGESFPQGDVFVPLFSDPKEIRSTLNYLWVSTKGFNAPVVLLGFGEHLGFYRWSHGPDGAQWQWGLSAGVFAQFKMDTLSKELLNNDYFVGIPLTWRSGKTSARLRVYHQSSHLGDRFLVGFPVPRANLSYESSELLLSRDIGKFRFYAGGEWYFARYPEELKPWVFHSGLEFRSPMGFFHLPPGRDAHWVAAIDAKTSKNDAVITGLDFKAGFEIGPTEESDRRRRRWSCTLEYYTGPLPYSQFFTERIEYFGLGFQLST